MNYILFDKVTKSYGYEKIFDEFSLKVLKGEHIGLIGNNGSGKTTFFRMVNGEETFDSGRLIVRNDIKIGYLEQETSSYNGMKIGEVLRLPFNDVLDAVTKLRKYEKKMETFSGNELVNLLDEYGKLQAFVEFKNGYNIDSQILAVANGIGIDVCRFDDKLDDLSGGERTRVFLCKLLLEEPDLLLLDEPTNHLDIIAVGWLEQFLATYKGTVITVSHDRAFLDNSVNKVIEIENKKATEYAGNFSWYKEEKARRIELQEKQFTNQQKEIKRLEKSAKQMRNWARQADNKAMFNRAVNVEKRIERMDKVDKPTSDSISMDLKLSNPSKSGKEIIRLDEIHKSFAGNPVLDGVSILIRRGEKVVISGENGSGKTTIVNIINGSLYADSGFVKVGEGIKTGYLPQDVFFEDEKRTLLEEVQRALASDAGKAHKILASYGFKGEHVMKKISDLSGGERKRLRFCTMMQHEYNLLIMDEPTNHMDIGSREILEDALSDYQATCLFISHDRFFINKVSNKRFLLVNGLLKEYMGEYTHLLREETDVAKQKKKIRDTKSAGISKNRLARLNSLESSIHETEDLIHALDLQMMELISLEELEVINNKKKELSVKLSKLYKLWEQDSQ